MPKFAHTLPSRLLLALVLAAAGTSACSGPAAPGTEEGTAQAALDPILADPRPGDLYAAEVTHFSGVSFGEDEDRKAYGLMKVREVTPDQVMVITEMGAWPKGRGAVNELRGDLSEITWDEREVIPLYRNELAGLVADGRILEVRRLDAQ